MLQETASIGGSSSTTLAGYIHCIDGFTAQRSSEKSSSCTNSEDYVQLLPSRKIGCNLEETLTVPFYWYSHSSDYDYCSISVTSNSYCTINTRPRAFAFQSSRTLSSTTETQRSYPTVGVLSWIKSKLFRF